MTATRQSPHVLIVGAGLAGLVLAQALRKRGISFEIFERDADIHSRFQGWAIALHQILPDFRASLPEDLGPVEVTSHLLPLDLNAEFKYYIEDTLMSSAENGDEHPFLRPNRNRLREYLVQHLDIQWAKVYTRIEETQDQVTLHFADGTTAHGDILVGADGVHSKVRGHLFPGQDLLYTLPLGLIVGETTLAKKEYEQAMTLGHSAYIAANQTATQRLMTAVDSVHSSGEYAKYYWIANWIEENVDEHGLPFTHQLSKEELCAHAKAHTSELDPKFFQVLHLTKPDGILTPPIVVRDLLLDSMPNTRITLIGDSAHAMTPFRGEGGNVAMQDFLDLARTIDKIRQAEGRDQLLALLKEYQDEMLAKSRPSVLASRAVALNKSHTPGRNFDHWAGSNESAGTAQPVAA